ncbi:MAG: hypothetical protein OEZ51_03995 [Nitrospinota bacterium]|nr:hypothetical protein [Nitrospinota bacterium]
MPSPAPTTIQWITAFILFVIFAWVLLALLWDILPIFWLKVDKPQKQALGIVLIIAVGALNYTLAREVLKWVWMGLLHILGIGLEEI